MSVVLESHEPNIQTLASARLRANMTAVRVSFTWLGVRKSLSSHQRDQAAQSFGAEGKFLSAGKKLLDTNHPAFKAVSTVRSTAITFWKGCSLPFPEPGIRLIRQDSIEDFNARMNSFRRELAAAVTQLAEHYGELRRAARDRLGAP